MLGLYPLETHQVSQLISLKLPQILGLYLLEIHQVSQFESLLSLSDKTFGPFFYQKCPKNAGDEEQKAERSC